MTHSSGQRGALRRILGAMILTLALGIGAPVTASGAISTPVERNEPVLPAHFPPSQALVSTIPLAGVCATAPQDSTTDRFTFEADGSWTLEWSAGDVDLVWMTVLDPAGAVVSAAVMGPAQAGSLESTGSGRFTVRYGPPGCHRFVVTATRAVWPARP